jgi:hypothetical protein
MLHLYLTLLRYIASQPLTGCSALLYDALLCYCWCVQAVWSSLEPKTQVLNSSNGGQITLLPYDK